MYSPCDTIDTVRGSQKENLTKILTIQKKGYKMKEPTKVERAKVKRSWFNMLGEWCYELENGKTIYIDYDGENITIEE